jgi:hypothetical protein
MWIGTTTSDWPSSYRRQIRLAFDGKDIEIMASSIWHDHLGSLMAHLADAVMVHLGLRLVPAGRAT